MSSRIRVALIYGSTREGRFCDTVAEWTAAQEPVAFVSYGGMSGGLRAVEQLRLVLAELHAVTIRDGVSFHLARDQFDQDGQPRDPVGCGAAASTMLDRLAWWALALRDARTRCPYGRKVVAA
jgi:NAD(P)H-dependent FMN reductase